MSQLAAAPIDIANEIALAETKLVGQVVKIARDPQTPPDAIRVALESLDPADQIRIADRVADVLQRQGQRSGNFETLERALPFLPGQSEGERQALEQAVEPRHRLSLNAGLIHEALTRVIEDRQPATLVAEALKEHARLGLEERERLQGPIRLPPGIDIPEPPQPFRRRPADPVPDIEISRPGNKPTLPETPDPPAIAARYEVRMKGDEREYYQRQDGQLAMVATDRRIQGMMRDGQTIGAMLDLATSRGWDSIQIAGTPDVARTTWIEATARGLQAEGYVPTRDDRQYAEQVRIARQQGVEPPPDIAGQRTQAPRQKRQTGHGKPGEGWTTQTAGYEALTPQARAAAERSYQTWARDNPELGAKHGLHSYVSYVQEKQAEAREQMPPPRVEIPRRGMAL